MDLNEPFIGKKKILNAKYSGNCIIRVEVFAQVEYIHPLTGMVNRPSVKRQEAVVTDHVYLILRVIIFTTPWNEVAIATWIYNSSSIVRVQGYDNGYLRLATTHCASSLTFHTYQLLIPIYRSRNHIYHNPWRLVFWLTGNHKKCIFL